jgi:hypothetical protein
MKPRSLSALRLVEGRTRLPPIRALSFLAVPLVTAVVLTGCGGGSTSADKPTTAYHAKRPATARCAEAMLGEWNPGWRKHATTAGPFGLFGIGRHFRNAFRRPNGVLLTKLPAVVEGSDDVVVRVPDGERRRVGLDYGDFSTAHGVRGASDQVTFKPCADRAGTGWPGGLVLLSRKPVVLDLSWAGNSARIRVG